MEEHTAPPGPERSLPRMTRGALLRRVGGGAGAALAAAALLSTPTMSIAKAAVAARRSHSRVKRVGDRGCGRQGDAGHLGLDEGGAVWVGHRAR
jgi:hypothetical protein